MVQPCFSQVVPYDALWKHVIIGPALHLPLPQLPSQTFNLHQSIQNPPKPRGLASHPLLKPTVSPHLAESTSRGFEDSKWRQIDTIVKPGVLQGILGHPGGAAGSHLCNGSVRRATMAKTTFISEKMAKPGHKRRSRAYHHCCGAQAIRQPAWA